MLVLSRKIGEEIVVGDDVKLVINRISGNRVTIGISAPSEVRIIRGELEPIVNSFRDQNESQRSGEISPNVHFGEADESAFIPPKAR